MSSSSRHHEACRDGVISITKFSSGPFWTCKLKPKLKYKSISNVLHLLSTPDSVPCAEPVLASLVVDSLSYCKFFSSAILSLIVDLHLHPPRALARRFVHSLVYHGQNSATTLCQHHPNRLVFKETSNF